MYILGCNKINGKNLIIANKYKSVILEGFSLLKDENKKIEFNHLYPFINFLKDLELHGIHLSIISKKEVSSIKNISVFFTQDISQEILDILKKLKAKESFCSIISIAEHPKYQIKNYLTYLSLFDLKISSFKIPYEQIKTFNAFIYKSIPTIQSQSIEKNFNKKILDGNIICSNLFTISSSNYEFRRHAINIMSSLSILDFKWFGRGWKFNLKSLLKKKDLKYMRSSLFSWPKLNKQSLKTYGGELIDKSILFYSKTSLSIENYSWPKGFVTEKFFEPLIYDCVPIYCLENLDHNFLDYINLNNSKNLVEKNMEQITRSMLHYKELSINDTKKEALFIKGRINKFIKESNYNTNLFHGFNAIMDKLA